MPQPPPLPLKKNNRVWIVVAIVCVVAVGALGFGAYQLLSTSGFAQTADQQFGDQNLKTAVALIELHKVRNGRYPAKLEDIRFTGDWDSMAIHSVRYIVAPDGMSYFVEMERGWIGKPRLSLPEDFWHGTGFNAGLNRGK